MPIILAGAGNLLRRWQTYLSDRWRRRPASMSHRGDPARQLALAAHRSREWQNIDVLLEALRRQESSSDLAA